MCTYNGAAWVVPQLCSFATQARLPDELVVCDDCSTDNTASLIAEFASHAPFEVRFVQNSQRLGVALNFSQAIDLSTGDLIALADQDDVWGRDKLEVLEQVLLSRPEVGLAFSDANLVDDGLRPTGIRLWETLYLDPLQRQRLTNGQAVRVLSRTNVVTGAAMLFRACHKPLILPISPHWIHDGWIALLISAVSACAMVDEALLDYRQHERQQIGARRTTLVDQARMGMEMGPSYFQLEALRWRDALERMQQHRHLMRYPQQDLQTLAEKAQFSIDRHRMRLNPAERWETIIQHWRVGDYHNMAWGWKSLLQDVVIQL